MEIHSLDFVDSTESWEKQKNIQSQLCSHALLILPSILTRSMINDDHTKTLEPDERKAMKDTVIAYLADHLAGWHWRWEV